MNFSSANINDNIKKNLSSIFLTTLTETEILIVINSSKNNSAPGCLDPIIIWNNCLKHFKIDLRKPVYENGDKFNVEL